MGNGHRVEVDGGKVDVRILVWLLGIAVSHQSGKDGDADFFFFVMASRAVYALRWANVIKDSWLTDSMLVLKLRLSRFISLHKHIQTNNQKYCSGFVKSSPFLREVYGGIKVLQYVKSHSIKNICYRRKKTIHRWLNFSSQYQRQTTFYLLLNFKLGLQFCGY